MWVRTTLTIKRWTEERTGRRADVWDESSDTTRLPSWKTGHLLSSVSSDSDLSTLSSEGECKETERCCWKHKQCAGHIIHPFSDYGHHNLYIHTISHCNCDSRLNNCSEKANNSSTRDVGQTYSRDGGSTCFNIHTPCFEFIPEEECVERFWYSWCKSYRPVSVAVIHNPTYHKYRADGLNGQEEEGSQPPIRTRVSSTDKPSDLNNCTVTGTPDLAVPITIWRSDSPTEKNQGSKVIKKVKKREKEKEDEMSDEKAKLKKAKKGKQTKKNSGKSESSPPDLSRSLSPRELARMSESSPESQEELRSEQSYNDRGKERPSSEDTAESSLSKKKEKSTDQTKKNGRKNSQTKKVTKRKSLPVSNPNLS